MIKLALPAGKASPAPPVGPALGQKQVNIMQFCKEYNAATADKAGMIIPVEITVYKVRARPACSWVGAVSRRGWGLLPPHACAASGLGRSARPPTKPNAGVHTAP